MLTKNLDDILKEFGNTMGLDLAFDGNGVCELEIADTVGISIRASEEDGTLTISSVLRDDLPDPISYSAILDLLALALDPALRGGNSPVVGRDDDSGMLIMYEVATPSVLNTTPLADIFADFIDTYRAVSVLLDNPTADLQPAKAEAGMIQA
ncbi:MAG: CesT family type III secretion system chaperone [Mailhella sp.]|nr:CesT family type III secretion system chaperone [Mailhella sp.]